MESSEIKYHPDNDGIDHINVYSKAKTYLGKVLSNFAFAPFTTNEDGEFSTVEGYWYYLQIDPSCIEREALRSTTGYESKKLGRELRMLHPFAMERKEFERKILSAISKKLTQNRYILDLLIDSGDLPLAHYYAYGYGDKIKVVNTTGSEFMISFLEKTRSHFQNLRNNKGN